MNKEQKILAQAFSMAIVQMVNSQPSDRDSLKSLLGNEIYLMDKLKTKEEPKEIKKI